MSTISHSLFLLIPVLIGKMLIPLALVALLQHYICKNKPKYSLVIPGLALAYFLVKFILIMVIGVMLNGANYYALWLPILMVICDGSFCVVTFLQHLHFKHQRENEIDFNKMKIKDL